MPDETTEETIARLTRERDRWTAEREMLAAEVVFLSCYRGYDDLRLCALTNDVFAPAADCEEVPDGEFWRLYRAFKAHGEAGVIAWAIERRGAEPFTPFNEPFRSGVDEARSYLATLTPEPPAP